MADEVDPLQTLLDAHTKRLQEISDQSFDSAKAMCGDTVAVLRKQAGFKSDVLDKALNVLGINQPQTGEQSNG